MFAAIIFGALAIGAGSAFIPDYARAKQAASKVFVILDRESKIESSLRDGYSIPEVSFCFPCLNILYS